MSQNISNPGHEYESKEESTAVKRSFFSNIEIVVTSKCNIGCRHCIYDCQPYSTEKLSKTVIKDLIRQAAALNCVKSIVFTGGEAFLEYNSLIESIALCEELGLEAAAVTNGYWAHTAQIAGQKLKELKGLRILNVSTDSFHQEFVPAEKIRNIIESCHELGIKCIVRISYLNNPGSEIGAIKEQLSGLDGLYSIVAIPVAPFGRAAALKETCSIYSYDPRGLPCCGADDPVIDANGDVKFCPGGLFSHPENRLLKVGNIYDETLEEIKKSADLNPVVQMLRLRGPGGLVRLVRDQAKKDGAPFVPPQTEEKRDLCSLCKYVIINPSNARTLQRAVRDPKVYHEIARESLQEFGETSMFYENLYSVADEINDEMIAESIADTIADTVADSIAD
jgi:MoaA/NifB/PqqE/SkfB family radical SAM enzyme